ncbi:MAG: M23 family metallopeptidase [Myxococcales bacterium]|nr:M23 family metallopeptidase [Myxococcales bacterium]
MADARVAVAGSGHLPKSLYGLSSLQIFKPRISLATWLRIPPKDRRVPIYNFFNRAEVPPTAAYSVRTVKTRDFQGGRWSYDSHRGTDFACSVGTPVVTVAPGRVVGLPFHLDRGGQKVVVDHGGGLVATYCHLARATVGVGEFVRRGDVVGLSGASGIEFALFFPWVAPHLHLNVWLDGFGVDPFAKLDEGEISLWRTGDNDPHPFDGEGDRGDEATFEPSRWDPERVREAIALCKDPRERGRLRSVADPHARGIELIVTRIFRGALFEAHPEITAERHPRASLLDLPFRREDFVGVAFPPARA